MARKWVADPPPSAREPAAPSTEPVDPQLADLRASLQHQVAVTKSLLDRSRQLKRDHRAQHLDLSKRLAKLPRASK